MTSRTREQLPDLVHELAVHELHLNACAVWRLVGLIAAPLVVALLTDITWITALCWTVPALMFYPLLRGWGYSALAIMLGMLPSYTYLELNAPANWLAFVAAFAGFFAVIYIMERLKSIRNLRSYLAEQDRNAGSGEQACQGWRGQSVGR